MSMSSVVSKLGGAAVGWVCAEAVVATVAEASLDPRTDCSLAVIAALGAHVLGQYGWILSKEWGDPTTEWWNSDRQETEHLHPHKAEMVRVLSAGRNVALSAATAVALIACRVGLQTLSDMP